MADRPRQRRYHSGKEAWHSPMKERVRRPNPGVNYGVADYKLASDPAENSPFEPNNPAEAIHKPGQKGATANHNWDGKPDAEYHQGEIPMGGCRHRHDVIETHDQVSNDDDSDRLPKRGNLPGLLFLRLALILTYQLDGNPDQDQPPYRLEKWNKKYLRDDRDKDDPKHDRSDRPADQTNNPLARGQGEDRHGDHQSIVTSKGEIDDDNA